MGLMEAAGFVLAGGKSSRMGRSKALLPYRGGVLIEWIIRAVEAAAGSVIVIGDPAGLAFLGREVRPDIRPGLGPLGGIETALTLSAADWNLIVACDMPGLEADFLAGLLEQARLSKEADCVVAVSEDSVAEPLCTVWHRSCLAQVASALDRGDPKVINTLSQLRQIRWKGGRPGSTVNVNTPSEWRRHLATRT